MRDLNNLIYKIANDVYDTICDRAVNEYKGTFAVIGDPTEEHWNEIALLVTSTIEQLKVVDQAGREQPTQPTS
jgi:hypothetical protein